MKRSAIYVLTVLMCVIYAGQTYAQKYEPTETWPYLFTDFRVGAVTMGNGNTVQTLKMNIAIDGKVHYINENDGKIMAADMLNIVSASFDEDIFCNVGGKMMKVLAQNSNGMVVSLIMIDTDAMGKSEIGYGISSSTASTQKLSALAGESSSLVNLPLSTIMSKREGGEKLPIRQRLFIRVGIDVIQASKKSLLDSSAVDKDTAKAFLKTAKIKWNDPVSLLAIVDFVAENNNYNK